VAQVIGRAVQMATPLVSESSRDAMDYIDPAALPTTGDGVRGYRAVQRNVPLGFVADTQLRTAT